MPLPETSEAGALSGPVLLALMVMAGVVTSVSLTEVFDVSTEDVIQKQSFMNRDFHDNNGVVEVMREEYMYPYVEGFRKSLARPAVEVGPGAFKSELVLYPEHLLKNQLEHLIKLKQKRQEQTKDLNT